jgi:3-hydroxyisobutyrate dehydrogenase-like beta-hydroxyacid dehydrogenase
MGDAVNRIGFIGMGAISAHIVRHLLVAGMPLDVFTHRSAVVGVEIRRAAPTDA